MAGFHENQVGNAGIDIVELPDSILLHECPAFEMVRRILLGLRRSDVIQHDSDSIGIVKLRRSDFFHHADRPPGGGVAHHQVGVGIYDLSRCDGR